MTAKRFDDHGHGFTLQQDLHAIERRLHDRRRMLEWMLSGATAAVIAACGGGSGGSSSSSTSTSTSSGSSSSSSSSCLAFPAETNGPYPSDGTNSVNGVVSDILTASGIVRSDIRSSFGSSTTEAAGVPLTLTITLEDTNTSCALLTGYAMYIWHCNRDGEYSLYATDLQNENYLRGVQVTDGNGQVTFQTIFPACYSGRYPHIHVEVYKSAALATGQANAILTTQLALPRDICSTVYSGATGYSASVTNLAAVTTASDGVFDTSTTAELSAQTPALAGSVAGGYTGAVTIGVAV
jgi:protocatechuate 3,4-dioxygenase beta subunit